MKTPLITYRGYVYFRQPKLIIDLMLTATVNFYKKNTEVITTRYPELEFNVNTYYIDSRLKVPIKDLDTTKKTIKQKLQRAKVLLKKRENQMNYFKDFPQPTEGAREICSDKEYIQELKTILDALTQNSLDFLMKE